MVRTSRRGARRLLLVGGLVLLVGATAATIAVIDLGQNGGTRQIADDAGVAYRVPRSWSGNDDNPPTVTWSEGETDVARLTHVPSGHSDAVDALQDAEPAVCSVEASAIDVRGADAAARCDNPDGTPATALGVLADGELWIITLDRSLSGDVRDDFVSSLDFSATPSS